MTAAAQPRVAIVDTGSGNLRSVEKALTVAGARAFVTADPDAIAAADKIVVPGQGHFGACIAGLERDGGLRRPAVRCRGRAQPRPVHRGGLRGSLSRRGRDPPSPT